MEVLPVLTADSISAGKFFEQMILKVLTSFLVAVSPSSVTPSSQFTWVQLKYEGNYDPFPESYRIFLKSLEENTSIETEGEKILIEPEDKNIFSFPFLYWTGVSSFKGFSDEGRANLLRYVKLGGLLLVDDAGESESGFLFSVRDELERIFGRGSIRTIPPDHVIFRSFFLFQIPEAERIHLEGINVDGRFGVIIGKALLKRFIFDETKFKLLLNIVLYSLTTDYKTDQVHQPFIKRRLR